MHTMQRWIAAKKERLDFGSVPAHNHERNCTKADQGNKRTETG
jgi:hypothetical protein